MSRKFHRDKAGRWRDERGRFVSIEKVQRSRRSQRGAMTRRESGKYTAEEEAILDDVRDLHRGSGRQPKGTEMELTATTRGGTPKRYEKGKKKGRPARWTDPRPLHLKMRVVLTHEMTVETARLLVARAVRDAEVPPGIQLHWIDWEKGQTGQVNSGHLTRQMRRALREFYGAITKGETRFEVVQ